MKKIFKKTIIAIAAVVLLCGGAIAIYAGDYYHTDPAVSQLIQQSENTATDNILVETADDMIVFYPKDIKAVFIFYPGGKVEYTAYSPLMHKLAQNNIACIITKMPLNLAVLDINAADNAYEKIANIENWYIGGHSLGGSMAASYLDSTENIFDGLILLASYSTADLTDNDVKVLSVYGSEDKVLNMESYTENRTNLPEATTEVVLDGGNHAQFGAYGEQNGDGIASISAEKQIEGTASLILEFITE